MSDRKLRCYWKKIGRPLAELKSGLMLTYVLNRIISDYEKQGVFKSQHVSGSRVETYSHLESAQLEEAPGHDSMRRSVSNLRVCLLARSTRGARPTVFGVGLPTTGDFMA